MHKIVGVASKPGPQAHHSRARSMLRTGEFGEYAFVLICPTLACADDGTVAYGTGYRQGQDTSHSRLRELPREDSGVC